MVLIVMAMVLLIHLGLECVVKRLIASWRRRKLSSGPVLYVRGEDEASEEECQSESEEESEETALLQEDKGNCSEELPR